MSAVAELLLPAAASVTRLIVNLNNKSIFKKRKKRTKQRKTLPACLAVTQGGELQHALAHYYHQARPGRHSPTPKSRRLPFSSPFPSRHVTPHRTPRPTGLPTRLPRRHAGPYALRPPPPPRHRHRQLNPRRGTRAESPPFSLLAKPNQSRGAGWGSAETESDDTARSATTHTSGGKRSRERGRDPQRPQQTQTATKSPAALTPPPPRPRGIPTPFR